jgi:hypothetical protein
MYVIHQWALTPQEQFNNKIYKHVECWVLWKRLEKGPKEEWHHKRNEILRAPGGGKQSSSHHIHDVTQAESQFFSSSARPPSRTRSLSSPPPRILCEFTIHPATSTILIVASWQPVTRDSTSQQVLPVHGYKTNSTWRVGTSARTRRSQLETLRSIDWVDQLLISLMEPRQPQSANRGDMATTVIIWWILAVLRWCHHANSPNQQV